MVTIPARQARAFRVIDNRTSERTSWDTDLLPDALTGLSDLDIFSFDDVLPLAVTAGKTDPDDIPETQKNPVTRTGDLWVLGKHRIVFQIRCQDAGAPPPPPADFEIRRVRRYKSALDVSDWLYFDIVGGKALTRFTINVRLHYADRTFLSCNETVGGLEKGRVKEGLVIPSVCGQDVEWVAAEFRPTAGMTCQGCGKYEFGNIPGGRAVPPGSTDSALELEQVLEDYQLADVRRRVDR